MSEAEAMESQTIKHMIEDGCADNVIPLPNVSSKILSMVIDFCRRHVRARAEDGKASSEPKKVAADDLKTFHAEFVIVDQATLFDLILVRPFPLCAPPCLPISIRLLIRCVRTELSSRRCLVIEIRDLGLGFCGHLPVLGDNVRICCYLL
jgi:hypothetical protein